MKETKEIPSIHPRVLLSAKPIIISKQELNTKALVALRIEKLCGKVLLEKENDMVMRNFVRMMYHLMANYDTGILPSITISDSGGSARTGYWGPAGTGTTGIRGAASATAPLWYQGGDTAEATLGIMIGTGGIAPARTDYALGAAVTHGAGAGQITYNRQTHALLSDSSFSLTREFTNAGSILSIIEASLQYGVAISATPYRFMLLRDAFAAISVGVGNGIRVIYTWSF